MIEAIARVVLAACAPAAVNNASPTVVEPRFPRAVALLVNSERLFVDSKSPGTGDLLSTNNLSELTNKATARGNLGSTTVGDALFTAAGAQAARTTLAIASIMRSYLSGL